MDAGHRCGPPLSSEGAATHSRILSALATLLIGACATVSGLDAYSTGAGAADASGDLRPPPGSEASPEADAMGSAPEESEASEPFEADEPSEAGQDASVEATTCTGGPLACDAGCAAPSTSCAGACVNTATDKNNCGGCGKACSGSTPDCSNSNCVSGCPASQTLCSGSCVDITSNVSNCGHCGSACSMANAASACASSKCTFTCNTGFALCNGACVDEQTDSNNCGGCGSTFACAAGLSCQSGACMLSQASPTCSACLVANCGSEYMAVDADPLAIAVANCGLQNMCVGTCCFCSGGPCTSCTGYGDGPCRAVIEKAAGVESPSVCETDGPTLETNCDTATNSCGKANVLGTCESAMCQSQCALAACN